MSTNNLIINFIHQERNRFSDRRNNSVAFSFGQITRYHNFLQIILQRYKEASKDFIANTKQLQEHAKNGGGTMGNEMQAIWETSLTLTDDLHLQMESFYLFSKIMLDKTSQAVEHYYGNERGISLVSHHKLSQCFPEYTKMKGLSNPSEFLLNLIAELQEKICDFRDDIITHMNNPRSMKATMFQFDTGETWISEHKVYPKDGEIQNQGLAPTRLIKALEQYIEEMINYIRQNKDKAKLE